MALLIIGMVFVGAAMVDSVATWQPTAVQLHKWLGLTLLVLVTLRLAYRLRHRAPALPSDLPKLQALGARAAHVGLYLLMFAMPLLGWAMQGAAGTPVMMPGGWVLPALLAPDLATYGLLRDLHALFAYTLFALILLHAGAGLYHGFVRRDGVLESMTGGDQVFTSDEPPLASSNSTPSSDTDTPPSPLGSSRPNENAPPG
ncbi:MAG: cytochrome B [Lysobacteraceae bacterium]|nr:MAG: cytochrome B [Xanthomonadaceae bacterium]